MKKFVIPEAKFILSCPRVEQAPSRYLPEVAFAGRSNVGKSSLINSLLDRRQIAMTSKTPGKTRLMNYFEIGDGLCYFVDLPGYGYARVPSAVKQEWGQGIEAYLRDSKRIALVIVLVDSRHEPSALDMQMADALAIYRRQWITVMTKTDKLKKSEISASKEVLSRTFVSLGAQEVVPYSSESHSGREEVWGLIQDAVLSMKK